MASNKELQEKIKRIVDVNTTFTQIHQQAERKGKVDIKALKSDLEDFVKNHCK